MLLKAGGRMEGNFLDTPHALTHAIVLPYAVKFVRSSVPDAVARLAHAMGTTVDDLFRGG